MGSESETDPTNGVLIRVVLVQETGRATARSNFLESVVNEEAFGPPRSVWSVGSRQSGDFAMFSNRVQ